MPQAEYELAPATTIESVLQRALVMRYQREQHDQVGRFPASVHIAFCKRDVAAADDIATHRPVTQMKLGGACYTRARLAGAETARDPVRCGKGQHAALDAIEQCHDQSAGGGR